MHQPSTIGRWRRRISRVTRAGDWWEHKLVPVFAVFYATALRLDRSILSLWREAAILLAALVVGASYVAVLNDVTDRKTDRGAGKPNTLEGRSQFVLAVLLGAPIAAGIGFAIAWRDSPLLVVAYLAAWASFTLYSAPPFRLKARGAAGIFADAAGAHMLPTVVAVLLVCRAAHARPDAAWIALAAAWSFAYGLRNILWHQLDDAVADAKMGVQTFVQRHSAAAARRLGREVAFPVECLALAGLLARLGAVAPILALLVYLAVAARRRPVFGQSVAFVDPRPPFWFAMREYYAVYLPYALIVAAAFAHPIDALVAPAQFLLFPVLAWRALRDAQALLGIRATRRRRVGAG